MDNSQMFLVLGATVLLAILVLNVNRTILSSTDNTFQAQSITAATSVAQQTIDLISSESFDESTVTAAVTDINNFSAPASLGPESGESLNSYDDVDDYRNYSTIVSTPRLGDVSVLVKVGYVNPALPDVLLSSRTRMKRIEVKAKSIYLPDTLRLYYYSSY
ncbi:hypothetical protein C0389_10285 [bacterium]|nr:hypothetical protein [bacterium]